MISQNDHVKWQLDWINISKGLGIYLVVLGHSSINPVLHRLIYCFHMPLFFCISGYLHSVKTDLRAFFKTKFVHLLLPYLSFLLVLYPLRLETILHHHGWHNPMLWSALKDGAWGGNRLQETYGVFWFLPCLFFTQQLVNFWLAQFRPPTVALLATVGVLLSYANALYAPQVFLPLDLNVVLGAVPFFLFGFIARRLTWRPRLYVPFIALGVGCTVYLNYLNVPILYNMRDGIYGVPGLSLVLACCCSLFLIGVSRLLEPVGFARTVIANLGGASMGIMFMHKAIVAAPGLSGFSVKHGYASSVLLTAVSYFVTQSLRRTVLTDALFLGSVNDLHQLRRRIVLSWHKWPGRAFSENPGLPER